MSGRHQQRARAQVAVVPQITGITVTGGNAQQRPDGIWEVQYSANPLDLATLRATITNARVLLWCRWVQNDRVISDGHLEYNISRNQIDAPDAFLSYRFEIGRDDRVLHRMDVEIRRVPVLVNALVLTGALLVDEGGGNYRSYAIGQGASITATAATVPATPAAYQYIAWTAGNAGPAANQRTIALDAAGQFDIQARVGRFQATAARRLTIVGGRPQDNPLGLHVERIVFTGGRPVVHDDPTHVRQAFDREWQRARGDDRANQSPQWYTRNAQVGIGRAEISVATRRTVDRRLRFRATAFFPRAGGPDYITWAGWGPITLSPRHDLITLNAADSSRLPNEVVNADPFHIFWEASIEGVDGGAWAWVHTTSLNVYVTFADPRRRYVLNGARGPRGWRTAERDTLGFYTLLAISCQAAQGVDQAHAAELVARIFRPFTQLDATTGANNEFRRKLFAGPGPMAYWKPYDTSSFDMWVVFAGQSNSARCGTWAEIFVAMAALHGAELQVTGAYPDGHVNGGAAGFLVRNWKFFAPPAESGTAYTHIGSPRQRGECYPGNRAGVVGQNNENPPPVFGDHAVVIDANDGGRIYDPSYGGSYANKQDWFYASIAGLFRNTLNPDHPNCGYSSTAVVRALPNVIVMVNQVTGQLVN